MNVEEIRAELMNLEERLDIDVEIFEYLVRDIFYADKIHVIASKSCMSIAKDFVSRLKSNLFGKIEMYSQGTKFKDTHCVIFISSEEEEDELIKIAASAKNSDSILYGIFANRTGGLAYLCYQSIHIRDETNFNEDVEYLLSVLYDRIEYYLESREYDVANPGALTMDSTKDLLNIPDDSVKVSRKHIVSPLESKKQTSESKWMMLIFIIMIWVIIFGLGIIINFLASVIGFNMDFNKMLIGCAIFCVAMTVVMIAMERSM